MTQEYVWKDMEMKSTFNIKPNYSIIFHRGNTQIGVLDFNGPEMTFSGDMDESAKLFLELVEKAFKTRLEQERAEEREACAKMCDLALFQCQETMNELDETEHIAQRIIQGAMNQSVKLSNAIRARGNT